MVIDYEPTPGRSRRRVLAPLLIGTAVGDMMFSTWISGIIIHAFGAEGQATITGSHGTGTVYNSHHVRAYDVLIRTADGRTIESGFADHDFNFCPHHNATTYPGEGDELTCVSIPLIEGRANERRKAPLGIPVKIAQLRRFHGQELRALDGGRRTIAWNRCNKYRRHRG